LRAVADGFVSILLPAYLLQLGYGAFEIGVLATATLLGSAILTLLTGMATSRFGYRRPLVAASGLMLFTGLGFAGLHAFWPLLLVGFVGTLNPSSGDASVFLPLEQSLLAHSVAAKDRTALFARYSFAGSVMGAVGALVAAVPGLARRV
jgi:MFS family permease